MIKLNNFKRKNVKIMKKSMKVKVFQFKMNKLVFFQERPMEKDKDLKKIKQMRKVN
jgi:hypothetical protein